MPPAADLFQRLQTFVDQWRAYAGTEQAGAQDFLRALLDCYDVEARPGTLFEQHPVKVPAKSAAAQGDLFAAGATQHTTERMDMYLPRVCIWEMKAPAEKDLQRHHAQLLGYWARMRTRYMVLCNFHEFWIYDTDDEDGQLVPKLRLPLADLPGRGDALLFLRGDKPDLVARSERITADVAARLGRLFRELVQGASDPLRERERVSKFLLECVFAMFAEDTELVPAGLFSNALREADRSGDLGPVRTLFADFGTRDPEQRTNRFAPYVNGPLFDRNPPRLHLTPGQVHDLYCAAKDFDWQDVRPEIFGSIFEQALDAVQRHEHGAHYTHEADIARVVGPTVVRPWQQRIAAIRTPQDAERVVAALQAFHVLDPACGCGNFLYVAYRELKRLESALVDRWYAVQRARAKRRADIRPAPPRPYVTLDQVHGIEIDDFAAFLARVVLWFGEHLAQRELGLDETTLPLKNLDETVRHADALFVDWPRPAGELAIIGNPPYLGVRKLRTELGDETVEALFARYPKNRAADYVTYWFARALDVLGPGERAGFVCTNSVAQNESREASIDRILAAGGTLTDAWKSYPWPGDAAVHIGIVNWVMAPFDGIRTLDGREVQAISPGLTAGVDVSRARPIAQNRGLCFMGVTPGNHGFVLTAAEREAILAADPASAAVIRPFLIGRDVNRTPDAGPTRFVIDFATLSKDEAEAYPGAMRHVRAHVYPERQSDSDRKTETEKGHWWQFVRPRPELRAVLKPLDHALVIPRVSPHLIVARQSADVCFDGQLMVVALSDLYVFGLLQSRLHTLWAWARGSTLEERLRYTNTTIFETFPFPPQADGRYDPRVVPDTPAARQVAATAETFAALRSAECQSRGQGLTKVMNDLAKGRPEALAAAYAALNDAVCEAYGFPPATWRDEGAALGRLVELNARLAE